MTDTGASDLATYLSEEADRVEEALERAVQRFEASDPSLPSDVLDALRYGVTTGGKRLRPILCVSAFTACGGRATDPLYDLAASLELIHAYSLMHDDLPCMDDAELRRGRPTTHREHGEAATVVGGAVLIPLAAEQALVASRALGARESQARSVCAILMEAAGAAGMVGGQWLDLMGEGRALTAQELDGLHRRKTGALLAASLLMGATAAGADGEAIKALGQYGRAVGLAFQIADDILDATASAEELGKNPSDADLDKATYVSLYGLEEARHRARIETNRAVDALSSAGIDAPKLVALARFMVERGR